MSGLTIYGALVPAHRVNLQGLENGIVMGYCPNHQTRWFIGDRGTCFNIKENAQVVDTLYPKIPKAKKNPKEAEHGEA